MLFRRCLISEVRPRNASARVRISSMNGLSRMDLPLRNILLGLVAAAGPLLSLPVAAEPANARMFKTQYGYMPGCSACHQDGGGSPLNTYGKAFQAARGNAAAFAAIAEGDADGDGIANAAEAAAKANPGDPESTPAAAGNWLDMSQLIPRQVQQAFPDARQYKPIDAILTDAELKRASAWGVTLEARDENTIYVPVVERRPVGTAVIVRGELGEQAYFVLVTTDRQLALDRVITIAGEGIPDAGAELYPQWRGATAATFDANVDEPVDVSLAQTVHKALALIQVRLKK